MFKSFQVIGKVQGIMFRQTFIRACLQRNIHAGATNDPSDRNLVTCSVEASEDAVIEKLIEDLTNLEKLNSWGAHVESLKVLKDSVAITKHEVTTDNVDNFNWSPDVEFFL
ncbi:hypothetical protein A9Q84_01975 [Halobacteriovorax marinus]|uniref:acylphosphatase n=1 Tax=Halobacteriovorax marinus TaxID=97084 RepID=A0A1Y5FCF9_9BACT|nr:hypothetical protein A9Q84_01975 [Halobacteriovorax marinus]